jgi:hypothetical protein
MNYLYISSSFARKPGKCWQDVYISLGWTERKHGIHLSLCSSSFLLFHLFKIIPMQFTICFFTLTHSLHRDFRHRRNSLSVQSFCRYQTSNSGMNEGSKVSTGVFSPGILRYLFPLLLCLCSLPRKHLMEWISLCIKKDKLQWMNVS